MGVCACLCSLNTNTNHVWTPRDKTRMIPIFSTENKARVSGVRHGQCVCWMCVCAEVSCGPKGECFYDAHFIMKKPTVLIRSPIRNAYFSPGCLPLLSWSARCCENFVIDTTISGLKVAHVGLRVRSCSGPQILHSNDATPPFSTRKHWMNAPRRAKPQ